MNAKPKTDVATIVRDTSETPPATRHFVTSIDVFSDPAAFEHAQRVANVFASSDLVPPHLRGNLANCLIAYQIARRLNEEPLTVFQNIYVVSGRPGWKTEYVIARANRSGVFKGRITWKAEGVGEDLAVTAMATLAEDGDIVEVTCDMAMAKAEGWTRNPKYTSMPEHMLRWRSAAMLIRLYAPEVMLGMPVIEEVETLPAARDVTPQAREAMRRSLDAFAAAPVDETFPAPDKQTGSAETEGGESPPGQAAGEAAPSQQSPPATEPSQGKSTPDAAKGAATAKQPAPAKDDKPADKDGKKGEFVPTTEGEYVGHANAWRDQLKDPAAGLSRWKVEKGLRNKCNVSPDARDDLLAKLNAKCAELSKAEG